MCGFLIRENMTDRASSDVNLKYTIMAVSSADGKTPVNLWADPSTHALVVNASVSLSIQNIPASALTQALAVQIVDGSGNQITTFGGGTQYTDGGTPPTHPVAPTLLYDNAGTWVHVSVSNPLPVTGGGGGTQYTQGNATPAHPIGSMVMFDSGGTIANVTAAIGLPVNVIAGSITANAGTNLNTSLLATSANLTSGTQKTQIVDGSNNVIASTSNALNISVTNSTLTIIGNKTNNNATPVATNIGALVAIANASAPTYTEGDQVLLSTDLAGNVRVTGSLSVGGTTDNAAYTAGTSTGTPAFGFYHSAIDTVTDGHTAALAIDSKRNLFTVLRDAAGNARGANVNASNQLSVSIDAVSATNISTNIAQVGGSSFSLGQQLATASLPVVLTAAQITTLTPPTTVTANQGGAPWSQNITQIGGSTLTIGQQLAAASIPVILPAATITTLTPPTTVTVQQGTASNLLAQVSNNGTFAVQATLNAETTKVIGTVNISAGQTIAVTNTGTFAVQEATLDAALIAQEATTSGVKGLTIFGAVTTNAPSYTNLKSDALSLTTGGALRADITTIAGTAPTTVGKLDMKGADGDVFVRQATAANLNATVVGTGTFAVQASLNAETTKVIGVVRTADGSGNLLTSTGNALDVNLKTGSIPSGTNAIGTVGTTSAAVNVNQVTSNTSATQLSASATTPTNGIVVQALSTNIASVFVGGSGVTTGNGFELQPGQAISFTAVLNTLYVIGSNATDKVCYNVQ